MDFLDNNITIPDNGKIFVGVPALEFIGISNTFPFTLQNSPGTTNPSALALNLRFSVSSTITIDYGDGTVRTFNTYTYSSIANSFYITTNTAFTDLLSYCPVHYYADGLTIERKVKISYNRAELIYFGQSGNMGMSVQALNFIWAAHPKLVTFSMTNVTYITSVNLSGLTSGTNPALKALALNFFNSASLYYTQLPVDILNIPIEDLTVGTLGYSTVSLADTKLDQIAVYPIKNTLIALRLSDMQFTNAIGLPSNWTSVNLPALRTLSFTGNLFTSPPTQVNALTALTFLRLTNMNTLTGYGTLSALTNLVTLDFTSTTVAHTLGNYPTYFNAFTKLRTIVYTNCGQTSQSVCTAIVDIVYDFISRNAPLTGATNGTVPFRGMTINLTVTSGTTNVNGTIEAPPGYSPGISNGTPTTTGHKIYLLRNQYGSSITTS